jgi:hypothetical protein
MARTRGSRKSQYYDGKRLHSSPCGRSLIDSSRSQRPRSAPLRSPLSLKTLGNAVQATGRALLVAVLLVLGCIAGVKHGAPVGLAAIPVDDVPSSAPRYSQQLSLEFIRIDPSDQPLEASLGASSLSDEERSLLKKLFPRGAVRFGMSGTSGLGGGARARMLVVVTDSLPPRSALRQPKGEDLVYIQSASAWKRYPDSANLLADTVEFWPSGHGDTIVVRFGPGKPKEFAWFIPRPS